MVDYSLYLVTDPEIGGRPVTDVVKQAIAGGVTCVQLRDKTATDEEIEATARELLEICGDVPLFIDDRIEVAARLGCNLHIGQSDIPFEKARARLAEDQLIGLSVGTDAELDATLAFAGRKPDVLGIGPVFSTTTKKDAPPGRGVKHVAALAERAHAHGISSVVIGGINASNAAQITGVDGICVVSAIMGAPNPEEAARTLRSLR